MRPTAQAALEESEAKYRFLAESMSQYVWTTDEFGKIDYCNRHFLEFTGLTLEDVRQGKTAEFIHPDDLPSLTEKFMRSMETGQPFQHEYRVRRASDGEYRWHYAQSERFSDAYGKKRWLGVGIDITDRKRAELELEKAHEQMRMLVTSISESFIALDSEWRFQYANDRVLRYLGKTWDEVKGRNMWELFPPAANSEFKQGYEKVMRERVPHSFEVKYPEPDGRIVYFQVHAYPTSDGLSALVADISGRKRAEEALMQSEKLAVAGRMAAAIAHEVNNPLAAVTNLAYLVSSDASLSETARQYMNLLINEVARASDITKQILAFYRDSSAPSQFDVREVVDNVLRLNRPNVDKRGIELVRDYRRMEPAFGYRSEIRQVFANLFANAVDAVADYGKIVIRVGVESSPVGAGKRIRITVADNGHGITPEARKRLFEPFMSTKGARGNGLGLWVSAGIVKKHGGRIAVRTSTSPGRSGTVFSVLLPLENGEAFQRNQPPRADDQMAASS